MVEVEKLTLDYRTEIGAVRAVAGVSFSIASSEILGLVGESGSGKSSVAMALLGHVAPAARVTAGRVLMHGKDILTLSERELASWRGRRIGLVPQNPSMGLAPHIRLGRQLAEIVLRHGLARDRQTAMEMARAEFGRVGLPDPDAIVHRYPHELSGGQQQRVCIAMALACRPELLVLDEPTTGLDVTTQMRIIELLKDVRRQFRIGMLYVTHDLALLSQIADRVGVMYAGRLVEIASAERIFAAPFHPYTRGLIASIPSLDAPRVKGRELHGLLQRDRLPPGCPFFPRCDHAEPECATIEPILEPAGHGHAVACWRWRAIVSEASATANLESTAAAWEAASPVPLIELDRVSLVYRRPGFWRRLLGSVDVPVVKDLTLSLNVGEIFALVGESGSGKSTIARSIGGLLAPVSGELRFLGAQVPGRLGVRPLDLKRKLQYVFQNPDASLNPRERVRDAIGRPLRLYFSSRSAEVSRRATLALEEVRLDPSYADRFPDQLSGGERQRVAIARALVAQPSLILCDEVLSALDVSVQANIIDLLARLRRETGVAMLFISHDLSVVRKLADRTGVLFQGTLVEVGPTAELFKPPFHPYTEELLLAAPTVRGRTPDYPPFHRHSNRVAEGQGCVYAVRCPRHRGDICDDVVPPWRTSASGHAIRCHIPLSELAAPIRVGEPDSPSARLAEPIGQTSIDALG